MTSYHTYSGDYTTQQNANWWDQSKESKEARIENALLQKFQLYDSNRDGVLEKDEFRSYLKDLFSKHLNQFIEDGIEETVWRVPHADFEAAKHAVVSINALRGGGESQATSKSVPFNAQGQQVQYPPTTSIPTSSQQQFTQFSLPPPLSVSSTPLPTVDYASLPPPPPMAPLQFEAAQTSLPPPPAGYGAGVGGLHRVPLSTNARPTSSSFSAPVTTMPPKQPAKVAARPPTFVPPTQEQLQERSMPAPTRMLPIDPAAKANLNSAAGASAEESRAFVEYINTSVAMQQDPDVRGILPISANSSDIYTIVSDGWLLCKLLNAIQPEIVPSTHIKLHPKNAFEKIENHTLALQAARKLGCKTVNIGPEDLLQGKPRLVLGLLWQIIKRDVLSKVSLAQHPEIYKLAGNSGNLKEISEISPEEVLMKWANHHLRNATKGNVQISNFSKDVKDGTTYTLLMNQVAPQVCTTDALRETDLRRRAQMIVDNAKKLNCDRFITPNDIVNGNDKLNLAFVADLFNKHSGLELPTLEEMEKLKKQNSSMSKILDEAEARLRQILADGQLAHELQQEEILLYRQRKLKEQEQLAEQEAMLRAQLKQEELQLLQQQRLKDMKLAEQESFAREEQKKEEIRSKRPGTSTSSASTSSYPRSSTTSSSLAKQAPAREFSSAYQPSSSSASSSAPAHPSNVYSTSAPAHPTYSSTTTPASSYPSTASYYPAANTSSASYATPSAYPQSYSTSTQSYPANSYSTTAPSYPANSYSTPSAPNPYNVAPAYGDQSSAPNPYNYPSAPSYAPEPSSTLSSTQTVYTEPHPLASYPEPSDSPVEVRRGGVFERVGKKIDRVFH